VRFRTERAEHSAEDDPYEEFFPLFSDISEYAIPIGENHE
jgi:hypothetical protein